MTTTAPSASATRWSSLENPEYRRLWWAGLWSFMSVQGQFVLRGLLAWQLTERESALGLIYLVFGVSMLVTTPMGGVAADRFPKRTVLIASQALIVIAAAFMAIVVLTGLIEFWMLLAAGVVQGLAFSLMGPARVAMSSELVGRDQLGNAITLSMLSMNGSRVFAPALAGVLAGVAFIGIGGTYALSAGISTVSLIQMARLPHRPAASTEKRNPVGELVAGVRYVAADPDLRRILIASFFVIMFGFNYVAFIPALVEGIFGLDDAWVGFVSSAGAIGAVAASFPMATRADGPSGLPIMIWSGIGFGISVMFFGLSPNIWATFVVAMIIGVNTTAFQTMSNTRALVRTADEMQGRVQSLMQLSFAGFGIAAAPLGALAEVIGLRQAFVVMGAVATVTMVLFAYFDRRGSR